MVHKKQDYDLLDTFIDSGSTHDDLKRSREAFILKLYGASGFESLDDYRHITYTNRQSVACNSLSSSFQLESLPPTSAAAKQHSHRTYLTVNNGWVTLYLQQNGAGDFRMMLLHL